MSLYPKKKLFCDFQTCFHSKVNGKTEVCEHTGEFFFDDLGDAVTVTKDDESNRLKNFCGAEETCDARFCEKSAIVVSTLIPEQWKKRNFCSKSQGDVLK